MKKIILPIFLVGFVICTYAQNNQVGENKKIDKTSLTIRPNSREYAPVRKTNMHQRMEVRRTRAMIQNRNRPQNLEQLKNKRKPTQPPTGNKINRYQQKQIRSRQEMQKRQQQRMARRKMIMQQQRKMRRR